MLKIGSHIPFKSPNYFVDSLKLSIENGANTMMIYLGPPQSTIRIDVNKYQVEKYFELSNIKGFIKVEDIIVHAPYIINLANFDKAEFSKKFLIEEIERMNYIGLKHLVLHPGAFLKQDINESIAFLAKNIKYVINKTKNVVISLETMAGKGTEIGTSFNQLKKLVDLIDEERIGICLDTCHMWDSGYDLKNDFLINNGRELFNILDNLNLTNKINVIHLNDSKNELGSKKDRHENIGKGHIGKEALIKFANHPNFKKIPIILETPWIDNKMIYKEEIKIIKSGE